MYTIKQTGAYTVGTRIISAEDHTRKEVLGPAAGYRKVSARLYYPAMTDEESKPIVNGENVMGEMYADVQPISGVAFPLLIYNHGYGSAMESNNLLCCELASRGYVVASVGHSYEAEKIIYEDGTSVLYDKTLKEKMVTPFFRGLFAALRLTKVKADPATMYEMFLEYQDKYAAFMVGRLSEWARDVLVIVEELKNRFADQIDFSFRIGAFGHSFGGAAAYYLCQYYDDFACGVNIDGGLFGHYEGKRMQKPFYQICCRGNIPVVSKAVLDTDAPVYFAVFEQMKHIGFTDTKFYATSRMMVGKMPPEIMHESLRRAHVEFFDKYIKGFDVKISTKSNSYVKYGIENFTNGRNS